MKRWVTYFLATGLGVLLGWATMPETEAQIGYNCCGIDYAVPSAGSSGNFWTLDGTVPIMNGSDTIRGLFVDLTNADHSGASNILYGIDVDTITGDAQATEIGIHVASGWDYDLGLQKGTYIYDNTNYFNIDATGHSGTGHVKINAKSGGGGSNIEFWYGAAARYVFESQPGAGSGGTMLDLGNGQSLTAMNGSDTVNLLHINIANADHSGSTNVLNGINIGAITGDAQASEYAINIGSGWDQNIRLSDGSDVTTFTITATFLSPSTGNYIVWDAPWACTVTNVRGYRVGGTTADINARQKGSDEHLSSDLTIASADTWTDGGAVQNTTYAAGDKLEMMITSVTGGPSQIAVQVDFTRP